jgi:two-component system response regulator HydG
LENVVERSVIMVRGDFITPDEFPGVLKSLDPEYEQISAEMLSGKSLKEMEKAMIMRTLQETDGNRTRAAEILGISRRTLQLKLREYGVN